MVATDVSQLLEQAGPTAKGYLKAAVAGIDEVFEPGYAKKNPQLVGVFMQVAAQDFNTAIAIKQREVEAEVKETAADELVGVIGELVDRIK